MIKSFRSRDVRDLSERGFSSKIDSRIQARLLRRLDVLNAAAALVDLNAPGFNFHPLKGFLPVRYSLHVNGPWCVTFEFREGDAYAVEFEQYH